MNKLLLKAILFGALTFTVFKADAQELQFQYDAAGNQIERKFACMNCTAFPVALAAAPLPMDSLNSFNTVKQNATKADRKITAYPNPFTQVLNLKWDNSDTYYVNRIEAYSSKGLTVFQKNYQSWEILSQYETIPFDKQVPGFYFIKAIYSDGKQQIIKVIKIDK